MQTLTSSYNIITGDIENALYALQFQDITRQEIEHVTEPMDKLKERLIKIAGNSGQVSELKKGILNDLKDIYTVDNERDVLNNLKGDNMCENAAVAATTNLGNNVELF